MRGEPIRGVDNIDMNTTISQIESLRRDETLSAWPHSRLHSSQSSYLQCCGNFLNYLIRLRKSPEELEQYYKSKEIDKFLEKEKQTFRRQVILFIFKIDIVFDLYAFKNIYRLNCYCWVQENLESQRF